MPKTYSTGDAARKIGVSRQTLQAWIDKDSIPIPKLKKIGRVSVRLWSHSDIQQARKFKGTLKPGRKGRRKQ